MVGGRGGGVLWLMKENDMDDLVGEMGEAMGIFKEMEFFWLSSEGKVGFY